MRRLLAAALAFALTACGAPVTGRTVTVWLYPVIDDETASRAFWQEVERGFESSHDIDLRIQLQPWAGRQEKIGTALLSGSGPDVVLLQPDMIPQYAAQRALQPVGDVVAASGTAFRPSAVSALTVNGEVYGVPLYQTVTTTVYNRALFAQAGITELPRTWDEVRAAAPRLAARGVPVLDYAGSAEETLNITFYPLLWQAGGTVFSPDGRRSAFSSPEGVAALRFLVDLAAAGGLPADVTTRKSDIRDDPVALGKAAMSHVTTAAEARAIAAGIGADNTAVGPPLQGRVRATFGQPGALALVRTAKDTAAARTVLAHLSSREVVDALCARSDFFAPWAEVAPPQDALARSFLDALPYASAGDPHPQARRVMGLLAPHLQAALLGRSTPEQALADAAAEVDGLLGR
ncbi:sugar ABC transporter substrate-binding protein [Lentzea sp. NPDC042327]|uniref:ABC transporter substrate-binding protein n=1 Tax=Lentzea sp. NPDC042327 TaxID=3154801 RepID=UPI0033FFAECD